ncbi:copper resistance CopC family protein [Microbacterium oleivorans]|uniref:Copper resistance protein CopC n=1 Tax=Microbacterium oleivorans TaxID=273677 RepID=A0A7D5IRH7_9MICO|nr:copper resistance CopC family protein [Microbacterium oleivorans]QLD12839.1 copper resistance protein CopC [Microbacterium oleivorans]
MSQRTPSSRPRLLAIAGLLLGLAATAAASPAFAHDELVASDPAADSTVAELPDELTLTFSGVLIDETGVNAISATDAAGAELAEGTPQLDGTRITQPLVGDSQGTITVRWRVVSSDGHPVSGEYSFVAGDPAQAPSAAPDAAPETTDGEGLPPAFWVVVSVAAAGGVTALIAALVAASRRRTED